MPKTDDRATPFQTLVALGESHVMGAGAPSESRRWVNLVAELIGRFQGSPVTLHNKGIGSNAISPRSPGYPSSKKPSGLERYRQDVIALNPDLFILSYGLNDMRAGMPADDFCQDMRRIIVDVKQACNPVIVLTTVYHMSAFDLYPPYDRGNAVATRTFNRTIRQLSKEQGCILADIWAAEGQADWVITPDTVHANELGHLLVGHRAFEAIATHCSGVAARVTAELADFRAKVERTMADRRKPQNYDQPGGVA